MPTPDPDAKACPKCGMNQTGAIHEGYRHFDCGSFAHASGQHHQQSKPCGELAALRSKLAAAEKERSQAERDIYALQQQWEAEEIGLQNQLSAATQEVERLKEKYESGEEWYIYNRDRNDARIRGPFASNIIAAAVRDEMECYGTYGNDNLVIMTEPKKDQPHAD